MARARNIKPGLFKNEVLGEADPNYTLLFEGLWTLADKAGRLEYRPKRIKAEIFPYRDVDVIKALAWLMHESFITMYEIEGIEYIQVANWLKHQTPHHKEVESIIPPPPKTTKQQQKQQDSHAKAKHELSIGQSSSKEIGSSPLIPDSFNLIPDSLNNQVVAIAPSDEINWDAWSEWVEYRREAKKKMTPATITKQHLFLAKYDYETQQQIIDNSIKQGWAGLFEPKEQVHANTQKPINGYQDTRRLSGAERTRLAREQARRRELAKQSSGMGCVESD